MDQSKELNPAKEEPSGGLLHCMHCQCDVGTAGIAQDNGRVLCPACYAAVGRVAQSEPYVYVNSDYPLSIILMLVAMGCGAWWGISYLDGEQVSLLAPVLTCLSISAALLAYFFPLRVTIIPESKVIEIDHTYWLWRTQKNFSDFSSVQISWWTVGRRYCHTLFLVHLVGPDCSLLVGKRFHLVEGQALGKRIARLTCLELDDQTLEVTRRLSPHDRAKLFPEQMKTYNESDQSKPRQIHLNTLIVLTLELGISIPLIMKFKDPLSIGLALIVVIGTYGMMERPKRAVVKRTAKGKPPDSQEMP